MEHLESLIVGDNEITTLSEGVCTLNICAKLDELFKTERHIAHLDGEVTGTMWADRDDHNICIGIIVVEIRTSNLEVIKYMKENGSGGYDEKWDEILDSGEVYVQFEIDEFERSSLPSFLEREPDGERLWVQSTRDDIEMHGYLNISYYFQPYFSNQLKKKRL
jgi:hypothetical protein